MKNAEGMTPRRTKKIHDTGTDLFLTLVAGNRILRGGHIQPRHRRGRDMLARLHRNNFPADFAK